MSEASAVKKTFPALRYAEFRWCFITYVLAMMADSIEHVISYWIMFQKFHSAALAGFAVVSHWLPVLLLSIPMGVLADRFDPRRLIQIGMVLLASVSLGWGYLFWTDTLQPWEAMLLLVIHGLSGVFWQAPTQLLLHSLVRREDLQSAVRLNATARYVGFLVGPAVGGILLLLLGPTAGILFNAALYVPAFFWLQRLVFHREDAGVPAVQTFNDVLTTTKEIARRPAIATMSILAAASAGLIGNSYQAQMPNFAADLMHGSSGIAYSLLLAADAAGALVGAFVLETFGGFQTSARNAVLLAVAWCIALAGFAISGMFVVALICLFAAGFFELAFNSMAQTVVQLDAPVRIRGSVLGLYAMAALGSRAFSGITVGLVGSILGVHTSLALAAGMFLLVGAMLLTFGRAKLATRLGLD